MKKIFSLILIFCMAATGFGVLNANYVAKAATPTGTPINNEEDFLSISNSSDNYYLASNITLSNYTPLNFSGTLNGNGYTISLSQDQNQAINLTRENTNVAEVADGVIESTIHIASELTSLKYSYNFIDENNQTHKSVSITLNSGLAAGDKTLVDRISTLFPTEDSATLATLISQNNITLNIEEVRTAQSGSMNIDDYFGISAYDNVRVTLNGADNDVATYTIPSLNNNYAGGVTFKITYKGNVYNYILDNISQDVKDIQIEKDGNLLLVRYTNELNEFEYRQQSIVDDDFTGSTLAALVNSNSISFGLGSLNSFFVDSFIFNQVKPTDYSKVFVNNLDRAISLSLQLVASQDGGETISSSEFTTVLSPGEHEIFFYIGGDPSRADGIFADNTQLQNPSLYNFTVNNLTQIEFYVENTSTQPVRYSFIVTGTPNSTGTGSNIESSEIVGYIGGEKSELISFTYSSLFGNITPSSYSFNTTAPEVTSISDAGGLFNRLTGATIKNLNIENWTTFTSSISTVGLLASTSEGAIIENVQVSGYIEVEANTSITAGGLIGSSTGTQIKNCYSTAQIMATGTSLTASQIVVGGLVGKMVEGEITNSFVFSESSDNLLRAEATKLDLDSESMPVSDVILGGLVGVVWKGNIINNFVSGNVYGSTVNDAVTPKIGLLFGELGTGVYLPSAGSISNNHAVSSSEYNLLGAASEYSLVNCTELESASIFREQSTFTSGNLWNSYYPWDFGSTWHSIANSNHIVLQPFQSFTITLAPSNDEPSSHVIASLEAASLGENNTIRYGDTVTITASIKEGEELLYRVSAIQKDGVNLNFEEEKDEAGNVLSVKVTFEMTAATSGLYNILTEAINHTLIIESADAAQGGVKIKGAQRDLESIEISISNDGVYEFEAVPATDYGFVEWVWVTIVDGQEVLTTARLGQYEEGMEDTRNQARQSVAVRFTSENLGNSYLYVPSPTEMNQTYTLRAIFTSQICSMTVRTSLSTENCATIYINEVPYDFTEENSYIFQGAISRDADVVIRIEVRDGYEFLGWQAGNTSDPIENFLRDSEATDEEITFRTSNQEFLLIANIEKSENAASDLTWLWWTLGGIGGAAIIGVAIWLIVRRSRRSSFMSDYY